jgi:hypothetical protein
MSLIDDVLTDEEKANAIKELNQPMPPPKGIEHSPYVEALRVLFGNASARMGASSGSSGYNRQTIPPGTMWPVTGGYNKQQAEHNVQSTKVESVKREWCKIPSLQKPYKCNGHIMGCCVCKTKTPANTPWWKPFKIMKVVGLLRKDFPYKDIYSTSRLDEGNLSYDKRDYYFAVCSEGCENFVYLALLEL